MINIHQDAIYDTSFYHIHICILSHIHVHLSHLRILLYYIILYLFSIISSHIYIYTYMHTYRQTDIQTDRHTDIQTERHTYIFNDSNPSSYPIRFPLFACQGSLSVPAASDTSLPPPQEPKHIGGAFRMERFDVWKGGFR